MDSKRPLWKWLLIALGASLGAVLIVALWMIWTAERVSRFEDKWAISTTASKGQEVPFK